MCNKHILFSNKTFFSSFKAFYFFNYKAKNKKACTIYLLIILFEFDFFAIKKYFIYIILKLGTTCNTLF